MNSPLRQVGVFMAPDGGPPEPNENIEIKARLQSVNSARQVAAEVATDRLADEHQVDTYFVCQSGRLKLREINGGTAHLIWYARADQADARPSRYLIATVADLPITKSVLTEALGIRVIVDKQREIYLCHNVRVHLDQVRELGCFLEFEAVREAGHSSAECYRRVAELRERFEFGDGALCPDSYSDMLLLAQSRTEASRCNKLLV